MKWRSVILQHSFLPARWPSNFCFRSLNISMPWQLDLQIVWLGYLEMRQAAIKKKQKQNQKTF